MDWLQVLTIVGGNLGIILPLFIWVQSASNSHRKETQDIIREDRREMVQIIRNLENFTRENLSAIRDEMKDFHARLVEIERGRK